MKKLTIEVIEEEGEKIRVAITPENTTARDLFYYQKLIETRLNIMLKIYTNCTEKDKGVIK